MKKVLSIVLALVMVMSLSVMLVPSASATTTTAASTSGVAATGVGGKVYYEQNFDDPALADLKDKDLAEALGWSAPKAGATLMIENGKVRIVAQYTPSGEYPTTAGGWGSGYDTNLVTDADLVKNTTVVEYKVKFNRREAGTENDLTVTTKDGNTKTVKADGQGSYQGSALYFAGAPGGVGSDNGLYSFRMTGNGHSNTVKGYTSTTGTGINWIVENKSLMSKVNEIPAGDTHVLEYLNDPKDSNSEADRTTKLMGKEYSVQIIVEPFAQRAYVFIDGLLISSIHTDQIQNYGKLDWSRLITDTLALNVKCGVDVEYDDIKISEYVPALTISEIMTNGQFVSGAVGKYQWIEITNPSDKNINVYDYAVHLFNMPAYTSTIGAEKDGGTNEYFINGGSTIGYFTPGAKTLSNGDVFNSPAYEDGVLAPGASAIVLFPHTILAGGSTDVATDAAFRTYLDGLGMPEGTMLLVADNKSEYPFAMSHNKGEGCSVGILKVTNQDTEGGYDPVANALGQPSIYINAFSECTAIITSKTDGGTNYYGMGVQKDSDGDAFQTNFPKSALGDGSFELSENKSYEISYTGWEAEHANLQWGFQKYSPKMVRKNAAGEDVYATPGYVPEDCRRAIDVSVTDLTGTTSMVIGKFLTEKKISIATPTKVGFATQIWLDGTLLQTATAETTEITLTAAQMTNASHEIEVKYYRAEPQVIGFQKSALDADGNYTLRILAGATSLDFEELGFQITAEMFDGEMVSAPKTYYVQYVYTSVTSTVDGVETTVTAESLGYKYLFAVHITGIDGTADGTEEDMFDESLKFTVNTLYVKDGQMTVTGDDTTIFTPNK